MASVVAAGILLSRLAGLVRESIFAHFLGNSAAADAFKAGFRIPNILQNLFGEGVLSASFIPVYSKMVARGEREEAELLAWSVGTILALAVSLMTVAGVLCAPYLIAVIAPGFHGAKRELTVMLVRILFPGAGLLVMSAWCLGVLNSHRRFFISYAAPVAWNLAIIATLVYYGPRRTPSGLAIDIAWGAVVGAGAQLVVQLPATLRLVRRLRLDFKRSREALQTVFANLGPVVAGRGVGQLSGYLDNILASLLPTGAVAALSYAQVLYMLPLSLFGWSVAASELPAMSQIQGGQAELAERLRDRMDSGLRQIAFLVIPSAAAFLFIGDVLVGLIFQSGSFKRADAVYVWSVLAGAAIGLFAIAMGRLYNSAFYALGDTRTPLKFAAIRFTLTGVLGYLSAIVLPPRLGIPPQWGVAALTASAGISGWVEFALLRWGLGRRIGPTGPGRSLVRKLWAIALVASASAVAAKLWLVPSAGPRLRALVVIPIFGAVYLGLARLTGITELERFLGYLMMRLRGQKRSGPRPPSL